ncbi:MAG: NRDE family protein [Haloarculaceae archaeon]
MCTFTLAWQVFEDAPVVVAANRDEQLGRETHPPARRDWERPVVAPKDAEAGGTWLGYNDAGVLVSVTNRWTDADIAAERSRGLLVRDALRQDSAEEAVRYVERDLDAWEYDGFNLVAADADAAILVEWDGVRRVRQLDPGVHVVVNVGADGQYAIPAQRQEVGEQQAGNADRLREHLRPEPGESSREWLDRAATAISDHEFGVCIHGDGFGTRSSSLVRLGPDGDTYEYADGPPCETPFEPVDL